MTDVHARTAAAPFDVDQPRHLVGLPRRLVVVSRAAALAAVAIGALVILGYLEEWSWAVELYPTLPPMYPNTALALIIGGASSLAASRVTRHRRIAGAVGFGAIGTYGAVTIVLHAFDAGPTVLESTWPDTSFVEATTPVGGRPVTETCVALVCLGVAGVMLALRRAPRLGQALALGTATVGVSAVLGFVIGVDRRDLGTSFVSVGMALHTAIGLTLIGTSVMLARPTTGIFGRLTHSGASATLNRRLLLAVVVAPVALTGLTALLARQMPDGGLALSVAAVAQVVSLGLLVMLPMAAAEEMEIAATDALRDARSLAEEVGERDPILGALTSQLTQAPAAPPGWDLGYRQVVAYARLPGDSCQVLLRPDRDDRFLVAILDLAGHGTEPALQALRLRTELAALWSAGASLEAISDVLDASTEAMSTIATGVLLSIDVQTGECEYLNAGHPEVLVFTDGVTETWGATQPLFGYARGRARVEHHCIARSALVVVHTDGVTEARPSTGPRGHDLIGASAIHGALTIPGVLTPDMVADAALDAALGHTGGRLRDDALVLVLQRR